MYPPITIPPLKKIISVLTPAGDSWQKGEFCASSHPCNREILIAVEGSCRYMMNNSVYTFEPGCVGLISPGVIHASEYTIHDHDLLHLWIHFSGSSGMQGLLLKVTKEGKYGKLPLKNNPVVFPSCMRDTLLRRWEQLESSGKSDDKTARDLMELPCLMLLNEFVLQWEGVLPSLKKSSLSGFLQSYIRSRIGKGCSISHLAELTGYSPSHISHVFISETGQTIGEFIKAVRTTYAAEALKRGLRQKTIADELGFSSPGAFWNWMQQIPELKKKD